ncbi:MAG: redoxin domain-containing protein, partial [Alphaproteobacteria bacterium]
MTVSRLLASAAVAALVGVWGFAGSGHISPAAAADSQKADDFELPDQNLLAHHLYSLGVDSKAVVLITQANGDPLVRANAAAYNGLKTAYAGKGVEVFMLNASANDSREAILKEAADYHYAVPVLQDLNQLVAEQLDVTKTGEVIVLDAKTWNIVYRGPVDDRVTRGATKSAATKTYAKDALDALLAGGPVKVAHLAAPGSPITLLSAKADASKISYVKDIAPIIQAKCISCHQAGGIGPMTLVNYEQVRGHSLMIREVLRTKRMPPFHADPRIGHFSNDKSLSSDQIRTLVRWIDEGAQRGTGADPLAAQTFKAPEWPLGTPDVVLNIPAYTIPATGIVAYQSPWAAMPANMGDRWLRASTVKVDQRQGVHHVLTHYLATVPTNGDPTRGGGGSGVSIGGYAVGSESTIMPNDTGSLVPNGGAIGFQMHYTPFGKAAVDNTKVG